MSLQRNYYEVLGVPEGASMDQIKKKYRELARKFHPDVVKDKDLGQRVFSQINQAYRVLNDSERRAQYDATLAAGPAANGTAPQKQAANGNAAQNGSAYTNGTSPANGTASRNGNGTAHGNGTGAQTRPAEGQTGSAQKVQAVGGLLANAENAIMAGKPVEARAFCVKVLEIDPRSVRALEILGDALDQMGKRDEAAAQYRKAVQITPSHSIQAKLTRVEKAAPAARPSANGSAPAASAPRPASPAPTRTAAAPAAAQAVADKAGGLLDRLLKRK